MVRFERPTRMVDDAVIEPVRQSVPPLGVWSIAYWRLPPVPTVREQPVRAWTGWATPGIDRAALPTRTAATSPRLARNERRMGGRTMTRRRVAEPRRAPWSAG